MSRWVIHPATSGDFTTLRRHRWTWVEENTHLGMNIRRTTGSHAWTMRLPTGVHCNPFDRIIRAGSSGKLQDPDPPGFLRVIPGNQCVLMGAQHTPV